MKNICHILNVATSPEDSEDPTPKILIGLDLKEFEQMPSMVQDLRNINCITLQVLVSDASGLTIFAPATSATPPVLIASVKYCCILTFVEM